MNKIFTPLLLASFCLLRITGFAQSVETENQSSAYPVELNDANHPCITTSEYEEIEKRCAENIRLLGLDITRSRSANSTTLGWPLRPATALLDCDYAYLSAGVDHNATNGAIKDYNCGTITYDGHGGNDLSIWPYNFHKMDNDLVEVVAAAPGTILYKSDGHFDRNCATNTDTANYIIIRHADGSQANYWHLKKNSVTTKAVGQTVIAGEYLGIVGSSGNSSGPHLHFEVWSGSTSATRIDPFSGSCNNLNAGTWWASQKPYKKTAVVKVSVNTTDIVVPGCPTTETPNESHSFQVPFQGAGLPAGFAKFYIFIQNDTPGINVNLSILNPNGSVFNSWTYTSTVNYKTSYKGWSKLLPTTAGTYTFKAAYNGTECSTNFEIVTATEVPQISDDVDFAISPNPARTTTTLNINETLLGKNATVTDIAGRTVAVIQLQAKNNQLEAELFCNGIYLVSIENEKGRLTRKVVIQK